MLAMLSLNVNLKSVLAKRIQWNSNIDMYRSGG